LQGVKIRAFVSEGGYLWLQPPKPELGDRNLDARTVTGKIRRIASEPDSQKPRTYLLKKRRGSSKRTCHSKSPSAPGPHAHRTGAPTCHARARLGVGVRVCARKRAAAAQEPSRSLASVRTW
jgi:hypothetical protein